MPFMITFFSYSFDMKNMLVKKNIELGNVIKIITKDIVLHIH